MAITSQEGEPLTTPTQAQLLIAIAALARSFTLPAVNGNQTGIFNGGSNALQIPIDTDNPQGVYNRQLGANLQIAADTDYIYISANVGDVSGGA